jgi:hypothetical protein
VTSRLPRIAELFRLLVFLLVCVPPGVEAYQEGEPVRARTGVRGYLLDGVFDNMTRPHLPAGGLPRFLPLRSRGLYAPEQIPGFTKQVQVLPDRSSIRFQTLYRTREVQKPVVIGFEEYLERVRMDQARRSMLVQFLSTRTEVERRGSLLEFEIPLNVPRGLEGVVGEGGAGLRVRGNRNIRFSGKSEWTEGAVSTATAYVSKFPSLNMEQESRFEIIGSVGSKVEVSVLQDTRALTDL